MSGRDALLVTGLGPVGLAAALMGKRLGATQVVGVDVVGERRQAALDLGAVDIAVAADGDALAAIRDATAGHGCEVAVDCSGAAAARALALQGTRRWGRCVLVGEGGRLDIDVSQVLIHPQLTVLGSWVTSVGRTAELLERLVRWELHPEVVVSHRLGLDDAARAYEVADTGQTGKVCLVMGD